MQKLEKGRRPEHEVAEPGNVAAVEALETGASTSPVTIYYLYFPSRKAAEKARTLLERRRLADTQVLHKGEASWLVQVTTRRDLDVDESPSQELMLAEIAKDCGGEYDGYATSLSPSTTKH